MARQQALALALFLFAVSYDFSNALEFASSGPYVQIAITAMKHALKDVCPDAELPEYKPCTTKEDKLALYRELVDTLSTCKLSSMCTTPAPTTTTTTTTTTTPTTTTATTPAPQPSTCQAAKNLTQSWRTDYEGSRLKPTNDNYNCDFTDMRNIGNPWFRFAGDAGVKLLDKCPKVYSCGGAGPLWSDDAMPSEVGTATEVNVYSSFFGNQCKWKTFQIKVMRCSSDPNDFVYQTDRAVNDCYFSLCGMK